MTRCSALVWRLLALSLVLSPAAGKAATCFHACFGAKKLSSDVTDQVLRETMQACHDSCEKSDRARLVSEGLEPLLKSCIPAPVSDAELKTIRSANTSVVAFANSFTWDVHNVLPDKIIRRVELATQTMSLEDIVLSASGYVEPGQTSTFYIGNIPDGYPAVRVTTRIQAIYACPKP
ncbi:MAG TPA: hypothetical protein VGG12_07780 [Methylovirgula sp.]